MASVIGVRPNCGRVAISESVTDWLICVSVVCTDTALARDFQNFGDLADFERDVLTHIGGRIELKRVHNGLAESGRLHG